MPITKEIMKELEKKFREIVNKYQYTDLEFLFVVRESETGEIFITGDSCPVCAAEAIKELHQEGQVHHIKNEPVETKH